VPQRQMERAIALWREGERLIETLPPDSLAARDVRSAISQLRSAHAALSDASGVTPELVDRAKRMIDEAERAIVASRDVTGPRDTSLGGATA
jgi:hypothetical protein